MGLSRRMTAPSHRGARIYLQRQATTALPERLVCRVCGFAGVSVDAGIGENFPTGFTVTGPTYSWTNANDAVALIDKVVTPVPDSGSSCPFCGATRYLDGSKGQGQ